jgi:uncharacterized membrane protein YfcA
MIVWVFAFLAMWLVFVGGIWILSLVLRGALYLFVACCYILIGILSLVRWIRWREERERIERREQPRAHTELHYNRWRRRWE